MKTFALLLPLFRRLAYLSKVALAIERTININGTTISTANGKKANPDFDNYIDLMDEYTDIVAKINSITRPKSDKSLIEKE